MITRPDQYRHNNPQLAIVDGDDVRGGARTVADWDALNALDAIAWDMLKENVTRVRVMNPSVGVGYHRPDPAPTVPTWYILTQRSSMPAPLPHWTIHSRWALDSAPDGNNGPVDWNDVENKPTTFPSAPHSHPASQITGLPDVAVSGSYTDLEDIPAAFTPSAHGHPIGDVTGLQTELNAKEFIANKVAAITSSSTHTEYGSAAAIWQLIELVRSGLLDGVVSEGNTLQKLYNLIQLRTRQFDVPNIAARNALNVRVGDYCMVGDDGDGNWALYRAQTDGVNASYRKVSDPDLLNAVMTSQQIKASYESNPDTNAFNNSYKALLDGLAAALASKYDASNPANYITSANLGSVVQGTNSTRTGVVLGGANWLENLHAINATGAYFVNFPAEPSYHGTWFHVEANDGQSAYQFKIDAHQATDSVIRYRIRVGPRDLVNPYNNWHGGSGFRTASEIHSHNIGQITGLSDRLAEEQYVSTTVTANTIAHAGSARNTFNQTAATALAANFTWNITGAAVSGELLFQKSTASNLTVTIAVPAGHTSLMADNGWSDPAAKQIIIAGAANSWCRINYVRSGTALFFTVIENYS